MDHLNIHLSLKMKTEKLNVPAVAAAVAAVATPGCHLVNDK